MELQARAGEFEAVDAVLIGLGYEVGQEGEKTVAQNGITSYPLLQETPRGPITRSLGLWSDQMDMPFMGYIIIDRSGRIVAREQVLNELPGAAPASVDRILAALEEARKGPAQGSDGAGG